MKRLSCAVTLVGALLATAAPAGALEPSKPSQIVTISTARTASPSTCGGFSNVFAFDTRHLPDGTDAPFSIPAGQVLVVTSGEVWYFGSASSTGTAELGIGNNSSFVSLSFVSSALTDSHGYAHEFFSFPTGIIVKSGRSLCVNNQGLTSLFATVNGFLARDN